MNKENASPINSILNSEIDLESKLESIMNLGNESAAKGEYDLAKQCFENAENLKEKIKAKDKKNLEEQHIIEVENLQQLYLKEIQQLNSDWSKKYNDLQERSVKAEERINDKQIKEMEKLYGEMEGKLNQKVKYSKEYYALENQEKMLVKFHKFDEAKIIRKKKEQQKARDIEKWNKEKNEKLKLQAVHKSNKQNNEKKVLKRKFETELDLLMVEQQKEVDKLEKKFQNKKLELDIQQKSERNLKENENILKKRQYGISYLNQSEVHHNRIITNMNQRNNNIPNSQRGEHEEVFIDDDNIKDKIEIHTQETYLKKTQPEDEDSSIRLLDTNSNNK